MVGWYINYTYCAGTPKLVNPEHAIVTLSLREIRPLPCRESPAMFNIPHEARRVSNSLTARSQTLLQNAVQTAATEHHLSCLCSSQHCLDLYSPWSSAAVRYCFRAATSLLRPSACAAGGAIPHVQRQRGIAKLEYPKPGAARPFLHPSC